MGITIKKTTKTNKTQKETFPFGKPITIDQFRQESFDDLNSGDLPIDDFKKEMEEKWQFSKK